MFQQNNLNLLSTLFIGSTIKNQIICMFIRKFVHDKKNNEIILIEVCLTNLNLLTQVENEKLRKYDLIANELALIYEYKVKIFPYVMTWDGLVTKYHKKYVNEIGLQTKTKAYIQSLDL